MILVVHLTVYPFSTISKVIKSFMTLLFQVILIDSSWIFFLVGSCIQNNSNWKSTCRDRIHKLDITKCAADQKKNVESPILLFVWMRRYVLYVFVGVFVAYFRSIFLDNWVMSSFKDVIFGLWSPDDSLVVEHILDIQYVIR